MRKPSLLPIVVLAFTSAASAASNCDDLLAEIDAKIRSAGVMRFTLTTVTADATVSGKVVGTCERGSRKIVYEAAATSPSSSPSSASSPALRRSNDGILTECKDGSVSVGGDCRK
ncbi:DUF1161 domain-containing protein [Variovorax sp. J22R24]|uniref:DUF1161 domain-containing protein n=1 Tax=Variovorax gracilis TaxID=3053502 RepID=UPI0025783688|nr:DUF1161 domain-containing protein [Variovorax sp. J22R24]MDM0108372.1 DUF1161 domain-containing protein [Variovorax sp. J22R24]